MTGSIGASRRVDILGVHVSALNPQTALDAVSAAVRNRQPGYVCVTGVHGVMESQADPELREIHNRSTLTTPDGMPMVWCGRWAGATDMSRVYGPTLMLAVLERAVSEGWTSFLYGGGDDVADLLAEKMTARFPGLRVVGTHTPPFRPLTVEEDEAVVAQIRALKPDLIWIGLSTPKQERWMDAHVGRFDTGLMFGVGAAFDINAGLLRQAPVMDAAAGARVVLSADRRASPTLEAVSLEQPPLRLGYCSSSSSAPGRSRVTRRELVSVCGALAAAGVLVAIAWWIVVPVHSWSGRIIWMATYSHGVHRGDLLAVPVLAVAAVCVLWAVGTVRRSVRPPVASPGARNRGGRRAVG